MNNFIEKWREICTSDIIEHLTVPRPMLFGWGTMILILQTVSILVRIEIFVQFIGWILLMVFFLFQQYCRVWKRYYSLFWPIFVHLTALVAAIYIKARYL